jgi:hypothetical protein
MVEAVINLNKEKAIFWSLILGIFMTLSLYIYYINITVHNVVARQNLDNEAKELLVDVGNKEFEYISKKNSINLSSAFSLGFKETKVLAYISDKKAENVAILSR